MKKNEKRTMDSLWHLKSRWYDSIRRAPGIRWILDREKTNLRNLMNGQSAGRSLILDIGTGAGSSLDLFPSGVPVIALDRSLAMLARASGRRTGLLRIAGDAQRLPFKSECVDFCACVGVTEYLPFPEAFLGEAVRVLAPGSKLLCTWAKPRLANRLRLFLGHRMWFLPEREWRRCLEQHGLRLLGRKSSWLQNQWICEKPAGNRSIRLKPRYKQTLSSPQSNDSMD